MLPKILVISNYHSISSVRPEAEIFIALAKKGYTIEVMTYPGSPYIPRFEEEGIKVIPFHPEKKLDKKEIAFIRNHLKEGGHDILHLFNGRAMVNGIQAAKDLPVKIVLYRGYAGNVHWYDPSAYWKFLHPAVDKIVCNSQAVEDWFHRQLFFDKTKTEMIIKGHDVRWYDDVEPLSLKAELDLPENAFTVLISANNRPVKDIPTFLKATYYIPPELPVYYILVGKDMDDKKAQKLIAKSPNREKIKFTGFRKDSLRLVRDADVFVLSSLSESFPKAAVEAMCLARPVIVTDIPGNREMATDGVHGLKIPVKRPELLAQKILEYYHNPELRKKLGKAAREHIKNDTSHQQSVEHFDRMYRGLVQKT